MHNQGDNQQFGSWLPPPPPPLQQPGPPVSVSPNAILTSSQSQSQSNLIPPPPPQNSNWSQSQHISPPQGQHFYRVPPPPTGSYFTPATFGSFAPPPSPPPGVPPQPPPAYGSSHVNGCDNNVKDTFDMNFMSDIIPPPPQMPENKDTVRKIEVLCNYIAKNGDEFEKMTCEKEVGNPEFEFLFGGSPGSEAAISHEYFKWMKKKCCSNELLETGHNTIISLSPANSDMDMEDDITQPEDSCIDIKAEEHACDSEQGANLPQVDLDNKAEQNNRNLHQEMKKSEESPFTFIQGYDSESDNEPHFENISPEPVSPHIKEEDTQLSKPKNPDKKKGPLFLNLAPKVLEPSRKREDLSKKEKDKLEVDEFGRVVKKGGSESDSDDYYKRKRDKRDRDRSRSRNINRNRSRSRSRERRMRSPPRRRERRSRSRSWSPERRSRSRSPYRRNRNQQQICYDNRKGKCYRTECRFIHESDEQIAESRHHKTRLNSSDKLIPEINSQDFEDPTTHSADVATGRETVDVNKLEIYPPLSAPPVATWNSLPPPPPLPRQQPQFQQNQLTFQTNYPYQTFVTPHMGVYPMNYPIIQQPVGPVIDNFPQISSNSRITNHYNPYASTFDQPLSTNFSSGVFNQNTDEGQMRHFTPNAPISSQYDPLLDSMNPSTNSVKRTEENDDAEVGAVENDSPTPHSSPADVAAGEVEIDQVKNKDSRSMKLFKVCLAEFVKGVLKPSWREGNMSKEAFKTIVKKTVDKVSGAMKKHQIPKNQAKINHYIDSSQTKLTKLVMGYVDKYVKV